MDKAEYQQRLDELTALVGEKDFKGALEIADSIDWRRVKSVKTLAMVADVYNYNRKPEKEKEILAIAQSRTSIGRGILARLVEVCLQLGQVEQAERYFRDFSKVAQNDNTRYVLQYQLYKAKRAPLEAQIAVLEEYREREYTERWAYELAELYSKAGEQEKCVEACDDLILWFSEGKYVLKAMELKKQYGPLSEKQQEIYSRERDAENERARQAAAARAAEEAAAREAAAREKAEARARAEAAAREKAEAEADAETGEDAPEDGLAEFPASTEVEFAEEEPEEEGPHLPIGEIRPAEPIETILLEDDADAQEEVEEEAEEEAEFTQEIPEKIKEEPADLKHRLLRSFHNMFGSTSDEEEFPEDAEEEAPEKSKEERRAKKREWPFKKKETVTEEPAEEELTIRELVSDSEVIPGEADMEEEEPADIVSDEPTKEIISDALPIEEKKQEIPFDLESFLKETAGSFSDEIGTGEFKVTTEEAPIRLDEDINTPEEEAARTKVSAAGIEELSAAVPLTSEESIQAVINGVEPIEEIRTAEEPAAEKPEPAASEAVEAAGEPAQPEKKKPHYIEELEIPDPEPTPEEKKSHTIPLGTIGQNTIPISIDKILSEESPEEQRIRILNRAKPTRMNEDQRRVFTYFARIPGMDSQILEALSSVYEHAGERTSLHGNIGVMGAKGTGKTRLSQGLVITMCKDLDLKVAKIARIRGEELNKKDPAKVVSIMSGGFLMIEDISKISDATLEKLNQAMEFRTDCMIVIIEDEKTAMRAFLKSHPVFATKFDKLISIPVFTNDELVTFARTYAAENGYQLDDLGILALYTKIGNQQSEEKPVTISEVKELVDGAIDHASKGRRRGKRGRDSSRMQILHEKDFE